MRRRLALLVALLLLTLLVLAVGPRAVLAELAAAEPWPLVVGALGSLGALAAWSEAQRRLHWAAGASVPAPRFFRGYLVGVFGKQVLPGGQIAGPAIVAYAVGRETDLPYEADLAAATVGKLLGTLAAVVPVAVGLAVVAVPQTVARPAVVALGVVTLGVVGVAGGVRARPDHLAAGFRRLGAVLHATLGRVSTHLRDRTTPEAVDATISRGRRTLGVVGADRRALAVAYGFTAVGWGLYAVALWGAATAVGLALPLTVALFVAPVASLGTLVPLPSGVGGVDLVLGALLVAFTGAGVATTAAAVLLYRVLVDVVPALAGAVAGLTAMGDER
ncbi:lysylphosphatidylglycerol synthase transmembrane domain-containing protein [Halorarius litoreus]|uniref:lysylphosphatidylglycerol synthase transmembrane domain-containing protein n=1 Tax=Halorarius litoreus TaxID=2962676 RepID=UPI0020CF66C9|nr:flippase-like domain-containing protein [Halorarius litoreus]